MCRQVCTKDCCHLVFVWCRAKLPCMSSPGSTPEPETYNSYKSILVLNQVKRFAASQISPLSKNLYPEASGLNRQPFRLEDQCHKTTNLNSETEAQQPGCVSNPHWSNYMDLAVWRNKRMQCVKMGLNKGVAFRGFKGLNTAPLRTLAATTTTKPTNNNNSRDYNNNSNSNNSNSSNNCHSKSKSTNDSPSSKTTFKNNNNNNSSSSSNKRNNSNSNGNINNNDSNKQ